MVRETASTFSVVSEPQRLKVDRKTQLKNPKLPSRRISPPSRRTSPRKKVTGRPPARVPGPVLPQGKKPLLPSSSGDTRRVSEELGGGGRSEDQRAGAPDISELNRK